LAKTAIRNVPTDLKHADIYLDDLFEIEEILSEPFARTNDPSTISFEYEIDDEVRLTTREELREHGGSSSKFRLNIILTRTEPGRDSQSKKAPCLYLYNTTSPSLYLPFGSSMNPWEIFGRVDQVFNARRNKLKILAESAPFWTQALSAIALALLVGFALPRRVPSGPREAAVLSAYFISISLYWVCGPLRKNKIYFRDAREDEKGRAKRRNERVEKLAFLLIGTLLGTLGTLVVAYLKH
jgi:hypothetical protein